MHPKVSYVMASYNHERYVGEMVASVLNQSIMEIELIVIDDGSQDATARIVEEYAARDSRVTCVRQENAGVVAARNLGLKISRAPFISIVDSDDLMEPDRTERLMRLLNDHEDAVLAYGDAWLIDDSGRKKVRFWEMHPVVEGDFSVALFSTYCFVPAPAVMFRREAMVASDLLWGSGPTTDYIKWIELGLFGSAVRLVGEPVAGWRHHGSNVSQSSGARRAQQYLDLVGDLSELLRRYPSFAAAVGARRERSRYARCYLKAGFFFGIAGEWERARNGFEDALRQEPSMVASLALLTTLVPFRSIAGPLFRWWDSRRGR